MKSYRRKTIIAAIALLWLTLTISLYFVGHKPFTPEIAGRLAKGIWQIIVALGLCAVAGGLGDLVSGQLFRKLGFRPLTAMALQSGLGLGLMSLLALLIGVFLPLHPAVILGVLALLATVTRRHINGWLRSWPDTIALWQESEPWGKMVGLGAMILLLSTLAVALAPPIKFDALVYHLALPERYLAAREFHYVPEVMFWGMPQVAELLHTWAIGLGGEQAAAILGWLVGLIALLGLVDYVSARLGNRAAWAALAALLSGATLASSLSWAYVDWWAILFGLGLLVSLDYWRETCDRRLLLLAGAYAGLALGTKYSAGAGLLAGIGVVALGGWDGADPRSRGISKLLKAVIPFTLAAVLVSAPWWIKNTLATGNPFYPFFIPAGSMDQFRLDFYTVPAFGGWQEAIFLPLRATFAGVEGAPGYSASIGPLLLGLAPFAWLGWRERTPLERLTITNSAVFSLVGLFLWAAAGRLSVYLLQSRLYMVIFPALAVLAGAAFSALSLLSWSGIRFGRVAGALVLLSFMFTVFQVSLSALKTRALDEVTGLIPAEEYLGENLGWYARTMQAVRDLPDGSQVLMLWEPRSLYCTPDCIPDEILDRWLHDSSAAKDSHGVVADWRAKGYTHLLLYRLGADFVKEDDRRYRAEDWEGLDSLLAGLPQPVDYGGAYQLYSLTGTP